MSAPAADAELLTGELGPAPKGPFATVVFAISGLAFVRGASRFVGRLTLAYRTPAVLRLSDRGLELSHRTEMLGRVLRESDLLIPLSNLSSVTREIRYRRIGPYAGLLGLVVGTYVGAGLLMDGLRVPGGSPSLLGLGLGAIALGILLDFVLDLVTDAATRTCRIVVTPRTGGNLCIHGLDPAAAERALSRIAEAGRKEPQPVETSSA